MPFLPAPATSGGTAPAVPDLVADLTSANPFYIGHRGSGDYWPEHTMAAYAGAVAAGAKAIEVSVVELGDGTFVCNHDLTLDRTAVGLTGQVARLNGAAVSGVKIREAGILGPLFEAGVPMTTLEQVLTRFGGSVVIFLESKQGGADRVRRMLEFAKRFIPALPQSVVFKTYRDGNSDIARNEFGVKVWGYLNSGEAAGVVDATVAASDYLGVPVFDTSVVGGVPMSDSEISAIVARGKPVIGWEVHRRHQVAKYSALGVKGMMCSGIPYITRSTAIQTEDSFDTLTRAPGELPRLYLANHSQDYAVNANDGEMILDAAFTCSTLMGAHCPIAPTSYFIEFEVKWDVLPGATEHIGIAFNKVDDSVYLFNNALTAQGGNHLILRSNGQIGLYTHAAGGTSGTQIGSTLATSALAAGQWAKIRIEVTSTDISYQRLDGTPSSKITAANTAYRGKYFHLTRNHDAASGQFARFRNVKTGAL